MKKTVALIFIIFTAGCSGPSDPVAKQGFEALELAYVIKVKPQDAAFTKCAYRFLENRHVVRCGISYGSPELAQKGFWEIDISSGKPIAYALNGKALSALGRIGESNEFKSGVGRPSLNIENAEIAFEK